MDYYENGYGSAISELEWRDSGSDQFVSVPANVLWHVPEKQVKVVPITLETARKANPDVLNEIVKLIGLDPAKVDWKADLVANGYVLKGRALGGYNFANKVEDPSTDASIIQTIVGQTVLYGGGGETKLAPKYEVEGFKSGRIDGHALINPDFRADTEKSVTTFTLTIGSGLYDGRPAVGSKLGESKADFDKVTWLTEPFTYTIKFTLYRTGTWVLDVSHPFNFRRSG